MKILASKSKSEEIFYYLAGNQLNNGILAAIANREFRLALLIGQCRQVQCRPLIMNQLVEWKQLGADKFIDEWKLKSYLLLAGLTSWETSSGEIVNASEGFDWLQVFALYCWFVSHPCSDMAGILKEYEKDFKSDRGLIRAPFSSTADEKIFDLRYQLMQLFSDRAANLRSLLSPQAYGKQLGDFFLAWNVGNILNSLEYSVDHVMESVHYETGIQLENSGNLWHWAVFPLLHVNDSKKREMLVKNFLARNVAKFDVTNEEFFVNRMKIPPEWIHEAKALFAHSIGRFADEAWHCCRAKFFNRAHRLFLSEVGPKAVASDKFDELHEFLSELLPFCDRIQDWPIGGQIYQDYFLLCKKLKEINDENPNWTTIEPILNSLVGKLNGMEVKCPMQRLSQAHMAKKVANVVRVVAGKNCELSIIPVVTKLPMLADDHLAQIRDFLPLANPLHSTIGQKNS